MRTASLAGVIAIGISVSGCSQFETGDLQRQVEAVERAFAKSMADRDLQKFRAFLSDEAVFLSGDTPLHGADAVAAAWAQYFETPTAPFSWEPRRVEVLESGRLALSTGPVFDAAGKQIMVFTSIWRQESPGVWRIVFDRGTRHCD